jgi:uncharacterized protein (TIGR02246 family)
MVSRCRSFAAALLLTSVLVATVLARPAFAAEDDSAAIAKMVGDQAMAWNAGDAHAFSADVAEDVAFVNVMGTSFRGREAFEKQHARIFATIYKGSHLVLHLERTEMLSPDVAYIELGIELSGYHGMPPGIPNPPDGVMRTHMLQVLKKVDGKWRVEAFYNVNVLPAGAPPAAK